MLPKWKSILVNWINCYFNEANEEELPTLVSIDSLLNIISHLRENFNLDESKSSILEAHTVEEFIDEKYPSFKFQNGTVEPTSEHELHIAASLLLFFVCVNSKDMDIKNAMCCQLSTEDQEIILKFTKRLMECFPILCRDVELAISEACGQDIASVEAQFTVAETPPAMRSLHGEVRRLQAALDAERFDRNYLQDELARTNARLETLIKEKEKYKLEILNLKAKISMCCDQHEAQGDNANAEGSSVKLIKQLQNLEESLVNTQSQLDDAQYERDTYKARVDELKRDRDKWLNLCEQKSSQADLLVEELDTEKRKVQSLKELVTELQQHRQLNRLDGSLLECDDPDASIHSMPHNSSICSEACANVVEVQLGEEREKINLLKQEIYSLQEQVAQLSNKFENGKKILSEKENDISILSNRLDEELADKKKLQEHLNNVVSKLNNDISEIGQKLKDSTDYSRFILENKSHEIKILQEEKSSLLQNLSDQTSKYDNMVMKLETDLDKERNSKSKIKEDYETLILNLNEKIFNLNNEVVTLQISLKTEGEELNKLKNKLLELQSEVRDKDKSRNEMEIKFKEEQHKVERLKCDNNDLSVKLKKSSEIILSKDKMIQTLQETICRLKNDIKEETENVSILNKQIQSLQEKLQEFSEKSEKDKKNYDTILSEKEIEILSLRHCVDKEQVENSKSKEHFNETICTLNNKIDKLEQRLHDSYEHSKNELENKRHEIQMLQEENSSLLQNLSDQSNKYEKNLKDLEKDLDTEKLSKTKIKEDYEYRILNLNNKISNKNNEVVELKNDALKNNETIETLQLSLKKEKDMQEEFLNNHNNEILVLNENNMKQQNELLERLNKLNSESAKLQTELHDKDRKIREKENDLKEEQHNVERLKCDNNYLNDKLQELSDNILSRNVKIKELEETVQRLNNDFGGEREQVTLLNQQTKLLQEKLQKITEKSENDKKNYDLDLSEKETEIFGLRHYMDEERSKKNIFEEHLNNEVCKLNNEINKLEQKLKDSNDHYRNELENKLHEIHMLQEDKLSLQQNLSDQSNRFENIVKSLEKDLEKERNSKLKIKEDYEKYILNVNEKISNRNNEVFELQNNNLEKSEIIEKLQISLRREKEMNEEFSNKYNNEIVILNEQNMKRHNELQGELTNLKSELSNLQTELQDKDRTNIEIEILLREEKQIVERLKLDNNNLDGKSKEFYQMIISKDEKIQLLEETVQRLNDNLREETEKTITLLNQQTTSQDELRDITKNHENDKNNYAQLLSEKENVILSLRQCLDEEIVEHNNLKESFDKLNNEIYVLRQNLKESYANSRKEVKKKLLDFQTLQEEKLSLLQSLSDNTSKYDAIVKNLQTEIEENKNTNLKIKEDYDGDISVLKINCNDLKNELDSIAIEHKIQIANLTEQLNSKTALSNDLEASLKEKVQENVEIQNSIKVLINDLEKYKTDKESEHQEFVIKLQGTKTLLEGNQIKNDEVLTKLRDEIQSLHSIIEEKETIIKTLENNVKQEKELKQLLSEEVNNCKQELIKEFAQKRIEDENLKKQDELWIQELKLETKTLKSRLEEQEQEMEVLEQLKMNYKKQEEEILQIADAVNSGLDELFNKLNEEDTDNEVLKKLSTTHIQDVTLNSKCNLLLQTVKAISTELSARKSLDRALKDKNEELCDVKQSLKQKEIELQEIQTENKRINQDIDAMKTELCKQIESFNTLNSKISQFNKLELENNSLRSELNDVKVQLEVKVHSLKEKLIDNENLTEKLKETYECQIDNLNIMIAKLTNYLKDKTVELDSIKTEKERLQQIIEDDKEEIKCLEENNKSQKQNQEAIIKDLESETLYLKNMITVTESAMEDLKTNFMKSNEDTTEKIKILEESLYNEKTILEEKESMIEELNELINKKQRFLYECTAHKEQYDNEISNLKEELSNKILNIELLETQKKEMTDKIQKQITTIERLEEEVKSRKLNEEKIIKDFESERLDLNSMITLSEAATEEQKVYLNKIISEHLKSNEVLTEEIKTLKELLDNEKEKSKITVEEKKKHSRELNEEKEMLLNEYSSQKKQFENKIGSLKEEISNKISNIELLETQNKEMNDKIQKQIIEIKCLEEDIKSQKQTQETILKDFESERLDLKNMITVTKSAMEDLKAKFLKSNELITEENKALKKMLDNEKENSETILEEKNIIACELNELHKEKEMLLNKCNSQKEQFENELRSFEEEISKRISSINLLETQKKEMNDKIQKQIIEIKCLEEKIKSQNQNQEAIIKDLESERLDLKNMITVTESAMEDLKTNLLKSNQDTTEEIKALKESLDNEKGISKTILEEKDSMIKELNELRNEKERLLYECNAQKEQYENEIRHLKESIFNKFTSIELLDTQKKEMTEKIQKHIIVAATSQEKVMSHKYSGQSERDIRDHQVDNTQTSDLAYSSLESIKTISDLEKIINDKNRTITTLQSDITYMKSLLAESENKLMDVTKDFELSTEHCQQLSSQLKKIVLQKNEEIAELKKQITKMSVTENRASQIIKVSAKYQAIILKRIAEIKSNTVLKELTNFGNTANCDNDLRRTINSGAITMEDLENFLETTDRHLRRCSEKQLLLQKERDRLTEVNRINESEIINLKKFLTELSVSYKTFTSVKDLYSQKLSVVISLQRSVRREILSLDGHITDATMCKLERGYAAIMQDLSECALNLERWVERSIGRTLSPEKIKQAFTSENERPSLASTTFQNASLEVQLEELQNSFQNLLGEVERARQGEGAKDVHSVTIMEVRAEYEDKLNRMKAKMKQIYQEQIQVFKDKQKEEIFLLQRELTKTREKMAESCRAYEEHIKSLTTELWNVGEKFLIKKDEAEWLRRKQRSGSVMSLQHMHSSGLTHDDTHRPSDTYSLRSLPVNTYAKSEGRPLHISDEEGEVFDNRWLKELATTPRRPSRASPPPGARLSELRWRNSLCPPHLKSSYPAETQFAPALDEEEIKCPATGTVSLGGKQQRKEVGITAYKKPGPPTPSKQAGRLSATDSELRESLRVELEPHPRKTSTPSRLRSIFQRSSKNDTAEGTPRSRRLSFFKKK